MGREVRIVRMSRDVVTRLNASVDGSGAAVGRVHSVFPRAMNIEWPDGRLLALHGPGALLAPFGAAVQRVEPFRPLRVGAAVTIEPRRLVAGDLMISWPRAEVVDCSVDAGRHSGGRPPRHLLDWRGRHSPSLDSSSAVAARAYLSAAIRERDAARLMTGAGALLGLGEGLTPSGDDCRVGALAVLHWVDQEWLRRGGPSVLGPLAGAARERTTAVGREFVTHALAGRFSEPVLAVLGAASRDEGRRAVSRLLALGATSGADTLSGMQLACRSLAA
jgi:hypothetical protein